MGSFPQPLCGGLAPSSPAPQSSSCSTSSSIHGFALTPCPPFPGPSWTRQDGWFLILSSNPRGPRGMAEVPFAPQQGAGPGQEESRTQGKGQGGVWAHGCAPCSLLPEEGSASLFHIISHSTKNVIAQSLPHSTHHRLPRLTRFLLHACFSVSFLPFVAFPFHPRERCGAELRPPALTRQFPCSPLLALGVLGLVLRYKMQQLRSISGNTAVIKPTVVLGH